MQPSSSEQRFRITPVTDRKQLDEFIKVPWTIYRDDPNWVPPLLFEQRQRLTESKNPFFQHAHWQAWTAWSGNRPVGRISAQIDRLYTADNGKTGYFGMLEAENDPALVNALLTTAEDWLRKENMQLVRGPFNLSINEECGLLVEGYDSPPYIMMGHARPYYDQLVDATGYRPAMDLLAYQISPDFNVPAVMRRLLEKASRRVNVRPLRRRQLKQELEILQDIFNDAWSDNWGFTPFTQAEFDDIGELLTLLVDDDFVQIAEIDDQPVAMIVALPNINEVIADLNGRLLPTGWLKLLWRLKVRYPASARIPLMGVRKAYHRSPLGPALAFMVVDAVRHGLIRRNIHNVELSWILENNSTMRNLIETCGGVITKRYRIYEKSL